MCSISEEHAIIQGGLDTCKLAKLADQDTLQIVALLSLLVKDALICQHLCISSIDVSNSWDCSTF